MNPYYHILQQLSYRYSDIYVPESVSARKRVAVVRALLEAGADPNATTTTYRNGTRIEVSAVQMALENGYTKSAQLLREAGAL
jgi:ankyrin repeat protein